MSRFSVPSVLAALMLTAATVPAAVAQTRVLTVAPDQTVVEGDTAGTTAVILEYTLDQPAVTEVTFQVYQSSGSLDVVPDVDYVAFPTTQLAIAPGESKAAITVHVLGDTRTEPDETFGVVVTDLVGATLQGGAATLVTIASDDVTDPGDWDVVDDVFEVPASASSPHMLSLDANDMGYRMLPVEIVEAPAHGSAESTIGGIVDYLPDEGFVGVDQFRYRMCVSTTCREGTATVRVLPFIPGELYSSGEFGAGIFHEADVSVPAALATTPLVAVTERSLPLAVDRFTENRWDAGGDHSVAGAVPAWTEGQPRERVLVFERHKHSSATFAVGLDADGDGVLARTEARCDSVRRCVIPYTVGDASANWIIRGHNRSEIATTLVVLVADVPLVPSDGSLSITGPGRYAAGWGASDWRLGWRDADFMHRFVIKAAVVRALGPDGTSLAEIPVIIESSPSIVPKQLHDGRAQGFPLRAHEVHSRVFFDVPTGVQALRIRVASDAAGGTPFAVYRPSSTPPSGPVDPFASDTLIPAAPNGDLAAATQTASATGTEVVIPAVLLAPGRWYVQPHNDSGSGTANITVTVDFDAAAPEIRAGSYFNPARPGSGVFLYPAADQWTGLWYTYFHPDRRPTWYYLQGAEPAADGVRTSQIWRATWNGESRALASVGEMTLTPTGPDEFQMTYTLEGITGTQPMEALGRGCPAHDGGDVDISSTWFDPSKTGTGYSVQMWADYEYHAAFVYDPQGVPMFLAAELDRYGGEEAILDLQRLTGSCPTCLFEPSIRTNVGTYVRRVASLALDAVEVDALWSDELSDYSFAPGAWTSSDTVQLLGGPGTTQGCAP